MKALPILLISLLLMGQDCSNDTPPPKPEEAGYCKGAVMEEAPSTLDKVGSSIASLYFSIVGGTPSDDRRATVFLHSVGVGSCTGTAIGPRAVLTAAHCVDEGDEFRIYLDPVGISPFYTADRVVIHPGYEANHAHDIALLLYDRPEIPGPYAAGVYDPAMTLFCDDVIASGWGQTEEVPVHPCPDGEARCLRESPYRVTEEGEFTLYTEQRIPGGICFGDSGGPLYAMIQGRYYLAGVTSWTASYDCLDRAGHVNVKAHEQWLYDNVPGLESQWAATGAIQ